MAHVVASLNNLLAEIDRIAPARDRASDGAIGDEAHRRRPSDHNPDESGVGEDSDADDYDEIRARDFDADLRRPGLTMEMIAQYLVQQCRAGRIRWIKYIIFNRRIWSASRGWVTRTYTGANPHDKHLHVSSKPDTASENDTRPLGLDSLLEDDMDLSDKVGHPRHTGRDVKMFFLDQWDVRDVLTGEIRPKAGSPLEKLVKMAEGWPALVAKMDAERAEMVPSADQVAAAVQGRITPQLADAVADRVVQRIGEMPDVEVHVGETVLKAAILAAVRDLTTPEVE